MTLILHISLFFCPFFLPHLSVLKSKVIPSCQTLQYKCCMAVFFLFFCWFPCWHLSALSTKMHTLLTCNILPIEMHYLKKKKIVLSVVSWMSTNMKKNIHFSWLFDKQLDNYLPLKKKKKKSSCVHLVPFPGASMMPKIEAWVLWHCRCTHSWWDDKNEKGGEKKDAVWGRGLWDDITLNCWMSSSMEGIPVCSTWKMNLLPDCIWNCLTVYYYY